MTEVINNAIYIRHQGLRQQQRNDRSRRSRGFSGNLRLKAGIKNPMLS